MWISHCFSIVFMVTLFEFSVVPITGDGLRRNSANYVDVPFYGSLPLNYYHLSPSIGQKRKLLNFDGARSLIGHSLRVRKSQGLQNNFAHALRIRRGRQFDTLGHTLRIKRAANDGWKSRGYALRVRRGENEFVDDQQQPMDLEALINENNFQDYMPNNDEIETWDNAGEFDPEGTLRPSQFIAERRSSNGVRLHALRVKKDDDSVNNAGFNNWSKRKASLTHVLRVRKDNKNLDQNSSPNYVNPY